MVVPRGHRYGTGTGTGARCRGSTDPNLHHKEAGGLGCNRTISGAVRTCDIGRNGRRGLKARDISTQRESARAEGMRNQYNERVRWLTVYDIRRVWGEGGGRGERGDRGRMDSDKQP